MSKKINFPLFLFSLIPVAYVLKGALPFDLTLWLYIMLYAIALVRLMVQKSGVKILKIDMLFYLWGLIMLFGTLYSPFTQAAFFKTMKFIFLGVSLIFFSRLFVKDMDDIEDTLKYLLINSTFTAYLVLVDFFTSGVATVRYQAFGEVVPIPLAMLGATTVLLSSFMFYFKRLNFFWYAISAFSGVSLIGIASSKGPVVALLATLLLMSPVFVKKINVKFGITIFLSSLFLIRIDFVNRALNSLVSRFLISDRDRSTAIRMDIYDDAALVFFERPIFGGGTYYNYPDYPHNFFLEVLSENGMILFLLVVLLLLMLAHKYYRFMINNRDNYVEAILLSFIIMSLGSLMFSFTYVDHKYLFLSVGLYIVYNQLLKYGYQVKMIEKTPRKKRKRKRYKLVW